jgi:hypothetical protein
MAASSQSSLVRNEDGTEIPFGDCEIHIMGPGDEISRHVLKGTPGYAFNYFVDDGYPQYTVSDFNKQSQKYTFGHDPDLPMTIDDFDFDEFFAQAKPDGVRASLWEIQAEGTTTGNFTRIGKNRFTQDIIDFKEVFTKMAKRKVPSHRFRFRIHRTPDSFAIYKSEKMIRNENWEEKAFGECTIKINNRLFPERTTQFHIQDELTNLWFNENMAEGGKFPMQPHDIDWDGFFPEHFIQGQKYISNRQAIQYSVYGGPLIQVSPNLRQAPAAGWISVIEAMAEKRVPNHCFVIEITRIPDQKVEASAKDQVKIRDTRGKGKPRLLENCEVKVILEVLDGPNIETLFPTTDIASEFYKTEVEAKTAAARPLTLKDLSFNKWTDRLDQFCADENVTLTSSSYALQYRLPPRPTKALPYPRINVRNETQWREGFRVMATHSMGVKGWLFTFTLKLLNKGVLGANNKSKKPPNSSRSISRTARIPSGYIPDSSDKNSKRIREDDDGAPRAKRVKRPRTEKVKHRLPPMAENDPYYPNPDDAISGEESEGYISGQESEDDSDWDSELEDDSYISNEDLLRK